MVLDRIVALEKCGAFWCPRDLDYLMVRVNASYHYLDKLSQINIDGS